MSIPKGEFRTSLDAILQGGLLAGTLDVFAAAAIYQVNPIRVLKSIAGGVLGRSAAAGNLSVAMLGLALQWGMSIVIAAIFVIAARRIPDLRNRWMISGSVYGLGVFVVMNYVVVPLSAAGTGTFPHFKLLHLIENIAAMVIFGLIVSFAAHRSRSTAPTPVRVG